MPVTLSGYDYTGKPVKLTIYTKPDGTFSFTGLVASNWAGYRITVDLPVVTAKPRQHRRLRGRLHAEVHQHICQHKYEQHGQ